MTNASNVIAGKPLVTGGVLVGDLETAAPTDASTALAAGFVALGYVGEDGLTEGTDRSTDKVRAWGGDTVKVLQTDFATTYSFTLIETLNGDVLKTIYGEDNVVTTAASASAGALHTVKVNGEVLPQKSYVFEVKDGDARIRIYVPKGQIVSVGEVTYSDSEVVGYAVEVEAFYDSELGANAIKYISDGRPTS